VRRDCNKPGRPRALLFDFNGVLMDDEHLHWRAFREVLRALGVRLTRAAYDARYLSFDDREACRRMLRDASRPPKDRSDAAVRRLVAAKRRRYRGLVRKGGHGVPARLAASVRVLARGFSLAVVSGAARAEVKAALRGAGLQRVFRLIVAAENVRRGKPHPEGYRKALRRLDVAAAEALAFEDSPGGIAAARAAGLRVVGIATSYAPSRLRRAGAFHVLRRAEGRSLARLVRGTAIRMPRTRSAPRRGWRAPRRRRSARRESSSGPRRES
jgi:beta-phosphoglucomutase-like phosphatase (HAD superfamily)